MLVNMNAWLKLLLFIGGLAALWLLCQTIHLYPRFFIYD